MSLFQLYLTTQKGKGDAAEISLPVTIATIPYRTENTQDSEIHYGEIMGNIVHC